MMPSPSRLGSLVCAVSVAAVLGALANGFMNLGDNFAGQIQQPDQLDMYEFSALAGTQVNFSVKASSSDIEPRLRIIDLSTETVVADSRGAKHTTIKNFTLPSTGAYRLVVNGDFGTMGGYSGKTNASVSDQITNIDGTESVAAGGTLSINFDAQAGWELDAKIRPKDKGPFMTNPTLRDPNGMLVSLTGFLKKNGPKVVISDLVLTEMGEYMLTAENTGLSGLVRYEIDLDDDNDDDSDSDSDDDSDTDSDNNGDSDSDSDSDSD